MPLVMWPTLVDMSKEESIQYLRHLELEAYSHLVSALRAQGSLNSDKKKLLKDTSSVLNITQERHNAEIRRAISDEKLNTIAYHITGQSESIEDWAQEGRRLVPIIPRMIPQTAYTSIADELSDNASHMNRQLPSPSSTERKRAINLSSTNVLAESAKSSFRIPEPPKFEETKKRKLSISENSSLAQHLLGPSKTSRIQQLYRQRTKTKSKDQYQFKIKDSEQSNIKTQYSGPSLVHPKINVLQNISLQPPSSAGEESADPLQIDSNLLKQTDQNHSTLTGISNENQAPRNKILTNLKSGNMTLKQVSCPLPGSSNEISKSVKMCPAKKTVAKTVSGGQKLIVVSNAQTIPSNSILQRTLSIPFVKNISVKNFEKFKIVTSSSSNSVQVSSANSNTANSVKHKVVTVRTNPTTKKVIPLSQLQVLNTKGNIKVLPLGGKIVGKTVTSTTSSPLYIMNTMGNMQTFTKSLSASTMISSKSLESSVEMTNNQIVTENTEKALSPVETSDKSSVLEDILKASGVINEDNVQEDYDAKIEEFHISHSISKANQHILVKPDCTNDADNTSVKDEVSCLENTKGSTLLEDNGIHPADVVDVKVETENHFDILNAGNMDSTEIQIEEFENTKLASFDNTALIIKEVN